ncbi:MAG: hypothetical protein HC906_16090 [Bacteroidales bacterium]|nr:hypothetical protein [Bacteroidales bacterium]
MKERVARVRFFLISIVIIFDILFYSTVTGFLAQLDIQISFLKLFLLTIPLPLTFILILTTLKINTFKRDPTILKTFYLLATLFLLFYLPKLIFSLFFLVNKFVYFLEAGVFALLRLFSIQPNAIPLSGITFFGIFISIFAFFLILYGMLIGRFNFTVEKVSLTFKNLPDKFDNYRLIHLSDIHLGTIAGQKKKIRKAVQIINKLEPDLILFTGDLVNNFSEEALGWTDVFSELKSKTKKISILGNHDYGDYWDWNSNLEKANNLELLRKFRKKWDSGYC